MTVDPDPAQVTTEGHPTIRKDGSSAAVSSPDVAPPVRRRLTKRLLRACGMTILLIGVAEITLRVGHLIKTGTWDYLPVVRMAAKLASWYDSTVGWETIK